MKFNKTARIGLGVILLVVVGLIVNMITSFPSVSLESPFRGAGSPPLRDLTTSFTTFATQTQTDAGNILGGSVQIRSVIFSAQISLETKDVRSALTQVASVAEQVGGYVAGSSATIFGSSEAATITVRIPKDKFYQAIAAIESFGKLKDKQTQSDDVTGEFIDLTARRDSLQMQEQKLQEILQLGKSVDDVLRVESELARVRGDVESLIGRINYLNNSVALSTIMVTFTKPPETPLPELDWTEPFKTGLVFLYATLRGLVILAFVVIPFVVIGGPAYVIYRRRRNKGTHPDAC